MNENHYVKSGEMVWKGRFENLRVEGSKKRVVVEVAKNSALNVFWSFYGGTQFVASFSPFLST